MSPIIHHLSKNESLSKTMASQQFSFDVLAGLSDTPKRLSSKYFYDAEGSRLFTEITRLEEYYPTRLEAEILEQHKGAIAHQLKDRSVNLIDLGAGDGQKTLILLRHFQQEGIDVKFVPIDISEAAISGLLDVIKKEFPKMECEGLVSEYFRGIHWLNTQQDDRVNLVLFLGSNIGNFDKSHARAHLRQMWTVLNPDDLLLVGFDLKKDIDLLLHAYNDSKGVTAKFNLNLLRRINNELGGNFDLQKFRHFSTYNVFSGAVESYLVSLEEQNVKIDALEIKFHFRAWEPIHTEYSYKYLKSDIHALAEKTGFQIDAEYFDTKQHFVDSLFRVKKINS